MDLIIGQHGSATLEYSNGDVNSCYEYDNAYNFFDKNEVGAGDTSVVILKEYCKALNFVNYILDYATSNKMKEIEF